MRRSTQASLFGAIAQQAADIYVPSAGVGLHGVGNGATGGIRIRGLGGSPNTQVLLVEDGVPDYQGIFGHPIPDAYQPFLVDQVLVIKGGDSVLFGTNALGGVVQLRSRWRHEAGYELSSESALGSYATLRQSLALLGRRGAWDLAVALHGLETDGHRPGAAGSSRVGQLALRYRAGRLRLTLRNKLVHITGADPGPVTHPTPDHRYDVWRENASLRLAYRRGVLRATLTPYLDLGIHRLYDGFASRDVVTGFVADSTLRLHPRLRLVLGLAGDQVFGAVENRSSGERPELTPMASLAVYTQLTLRPFDALSLVLGGRALYSSRYGAVWLYKAGASWEVYRGLRLRARLVRNFRQPTLRELYLPFPTANPQLRPEFALNGDVGLDFVSRHLSASCAAYRTEARDLIKYFGAWPAAEVVNIDHLLLWGVEGRVALERLGPLSLSVAGNWQHVGRYTRQNPDAKVDLAARLWLPLGRHFVGATLDVSWVHGLYMADYGRRPLDNVFVADLALRYHHGSWRHGSGRQLALEPYLLLRNLLDRRYAYVEGYPMPGFNLLLGLKLGI